MFQKNLQDLVKGIRSQKKDASAFISQAIAEIKLELKSTDPFVKAEAVRKLTFLQMNGYNVSWASFSIIEVMSQNRFAHKRIGYLAANQSFNENTDVILLTTNLFKKEFAQGSSASQYEIGMAINSLANIVTTDLARDCISDLVTLMSNSKPYVRKKATLAIYKLYVKYPQGLRLTFDKLKEQLADTESAVVSCAVNVICELANKNPKNYLAMAPTFFRLLTTSANNWMLIKVVKLLGSLVSEEPRLARKLLEPLSTIIQNTTAKSLQYECINTVTQALPFTKREDGSDAKNAPMVVKLCSDNLRQFIEDPDQNLKYLGLVGLVQLMVSHPKAVVDHREIVLQCLNDDDVTIRTRALELLAGMVTKKTIVDLILHLKEHIKRAEGTYRDEIISKILLIGSRDKFAFVTDFAWYTTILLDLADMQGNKHGKDVAEQLIEIALRVDTVRPFTVEAMLTMLLDEDLILGQARVTVSEVLRAAAWIVGEYSEIVTEIANDDADDEVDDDGGGYWIEGPTGEEIRSTWRSQPLHHMTIASLLHPRATNLPAHVQAAYMQAAIKLFIRASLDCSETQLVDIVGVLRSRINVFLQSVHIEVQERASTLRQLLAEFEILPLDWEEQAEMEKRESEEDGKVPEVELLFAPVYTKTSVDAVDERGAKAAKSKSVVLASLIAEPFYAVHSKAQRRVPVPEGLDLDIAFNAAALDQLLSIEEPQVNIASVSFTGFASYADERDSTGPAMDEEETRIAKLIKSSFQDGEDYAYSGVLGNDVAASIPTAKSANVSLNPAANQSGDERFFYLGGGDAVPVKEEGKTGKKGKKSKVKSVAVNKVEMLPAGAIDSDDEHKAVKKLKGKTKSSSPSIAVVEKDVKKKKKKGTNDLGDIDITTPLRPGEALPVMAHHVVVSRPAPAPVSAPTPVPTVAAVDVEDGKKPKKEKKNKGDKKESKKAKASTGAVVEDLLSMDWAVPSPAPVPAAAVSSLDFLGGSDKGMSVPEEGAKKKSSSKLVWQSLCSERDVDVHYAFSASSSTTLTLYARCINNAADGVNATVDLTLANLPVPTLRLGHASMLRIATSTPSGSESQSCLDLGVDAPTQTILPIQGLVKYTFESLLGADVRSYNVTMSLTPTVFFSPNKLSEEAFGTLMGKSTSKWGTATTPRIGYSSKAKSAFKAIATFLHAHTVDSETSTKAVNMASKTHSGAYVCCLAKSKSDAIVVDIKVLGSTKAEGQALADAIATALSALSL